MKQRLGRVRLRYSLRLLMTCFVCITALVALYREPLRRHLETLMSRSGKSVDHLVITGPQTTGMPVALDPPSPSEIWRALADAGEASKPAADCRMLIEPLADYVDPPRFSWPTGTWQLHHAQYKCIIISASGQRTLHIDHNHRCIPGPPTNGAQ